MEQLSREEGNHSKHQKSKIIAVIERVSGNCGVTCYVNWNCSYFIKSCVGFFCLFIYITLSFFFYFLLFSERESNSSVQYIYYKAKHFQHFHYIYNLTRDCHDRIERLRKTNDRANFMTEDIVIKIGIVGKSSEDKLCSLLKRRGKV